MIEQDITNVPNLNDCVRFDVCNGFDGLCHDRPMFGGGDCETGFMIIVLVVKEFVLVRLKE